MSEVVYTSEVRIERREGPLRMAYMPAEKEPFTASLERRIKEDYETGNIVTIEGWILSATEGRQCALFSLIQTK